MGGGGLGWVMLLTQNVVRADLRVFCSFVFKSNICVSFFCLFFGYYRLVTVLCDGLFCAFSTFRCIPVAYTPLPVGTHTHTHVRQSQMSSDTATRPLGQVKPVENPALQKEDV